MNANAQLAMDAFEAKFYNIAKVLPFNPRWMDGIRYISVSEPYMAELPENSFAKSMTPDDEMIIFVGTALGNVAIYPRKMGTYKYLTFTASKEIFDSMALSTVTSPLNFEDLTTLFKAAKIISNMCEATA